MQCGCRWWTLQANLLPLCRHGSYTAEIHHCQEALQAETYNGTQNPFPFEGRILQGHGKPCFYW